ncbi:MAG: TIGR01906 family membrane protein [Firmicutes bacterium HGW-Firmicutes-1]|jgi:integral membrane protein (TIGR01906 family)|nr:MAG: TIGR01906 family membrane protein [Firmicutes bacterium HGW-Firmicutes-1]
MYKFYSKAIAIVFSLTLFFVLLFASVNIIVYNMDYYKWHYEKRDIDINTGMEMNDLVMVTEKLLNYLKNDDDNLNMKKLINGKVEEVFGDREKSHMVDVKKMSVAATATRNYGAILVIAIITLAYINNKKLFLYILSSIKYVFIGTTAIVLGIGALLLIDFNKYFTIFHEIFFTNDLWLLDPQTDILINMVPEVFFFNTAMLVILLFLLISSIVIVGAEKAKKKMKIKLG